MPRPSKMKKTKLTLRLASLVLAMGASRTMLGQSVFTEDQPEYPPLTMPQLKYLKMDVEAEQIRDTPSSGGASSQTRRIYLAPSAGIGWNYFLYYPDLMTFSILAEPGYTWQQYNVDGISSSQNSLLLNGNLNATLLPYKPYSTTFNYSRSHGDYHYDFFNSATVDTEAWGVSTGYHEGPVPVTVNYEQTSTDTSGLVYDSTTEQTMLNVRARSQRERADTDLSYQFTTYKSTAAGFTSDSTTHSLTLTDVEHFSDNLTLNSTFNYNHFENQGLVSDNPATTLDLNWEHTPQLRSFYDVSASDFSTEGADSMNSYARAGLEHKLYESLTSTFDVHGSDASSDSAGSKIDSRSAGTTLAEAYTKRLGDWGVLSVNDAASYDVTFQDSSGGQLPVFDESHTVPAPGWFLLTLPGVTSVTSITYLNGGATVTLDASTDYTVTSVGNLTQIRMTPTGMTKLASAAPPATSVNVSYIAQPNPTGSYSTVNNETEVRLGFWKQRAGIYVRYNFCENEAGSAGFVFDNYNEFQAGADLNWWHLRLDANYTDRQSSLESYHTLTLSEDYTLLSTLKYSAGLDFNQQWNSFSDSGGTGSTEDTSFYSFTGRYEWRPVSRLSWRNEAGYQIQRGAGSDQNYLVARSYVSWLVGKLDFHLGYEFEHQDYTTETRVRNFAYLWMQRNF